MTKTYRPSVSQRLIWFDQVRSPASSKYNIGGFAQLWGGLSYERFNQTLRRIIDAQEVYTTRIMEIDFEPVCVVEGLPFDYAIPIIDLSLAPDPERTALERMEEDFALPFEIEGNYLYKFLLFKISDTKHFWYAKIHHIISDGMSFKLLLNQAAEIYNLYGNDAGTEDIRYAYSEYALEDERYYQSQEMAADREYWINEFHASREALLHKRSRGGSGSAAGSDTLLIPKGSKDMLQALADHHKASVFNVILALVLIYFARTRGCNEIVVGVPVLNRTKKKYRSTAGVFMNLLALPFAVDTGGTLGDIIRMTKEGMSKALRHQRYQYGNLVNELQLAEGKPLYDIRISYEDFAFTSTFGDLKSAATALSNHAEIDKLAIYLRDYHNEGFDVRFVYDRDFLSDEEIRSIKCCLETSIRTALASGSVAVEEMELLDEEEKRRIIEFSTGPAKPRPRHSFPQLWEEVCLAYPDNICISCVSGTYSVTDIDHRSTLLSHSLRSLKENKRIDKVALLLPRSEKMIVAMLGCMKASLAYIPLDHEYPVFRVNLILKDAGCRILLTSNEFPRSAEGDGLYDAETMVIEEEDHPIRAQQAPEAGSGMDDDVCYIIYTSGSTGKPKGVGISSSSLADYVYTFREYFSLSAEDVVLQQSSFAFDTSVEEIFPILSVGGRLHILADRRDILELKDALMNASVTLLSTTPLILRELNGSILPPCLRAIVSGGDVLDTDHIAEILGQPVAVHNSYGPTESTVCATYFRVTGPMEEIPIGMPLANREVFVLDDRFRLQPLGVEGELFIAGSGLARGYINNRSLTDEVFIPHFLDGSRRMYRTGDIGVMMPDGKICFRRRKDDQLKFRGYRIEAGEIEKMLGQKCNIPGCVVCVKEWNGQPVLTAYFDHDGGMPLKVTAIRKTLLEFLPSYMIPEAFAAVTKFPLLPGGKIDRSMLPAVAPWSVSGDPGRRQPTTELEKKIYRIWTDVLGSSGFGIEESFFEVGGNSLYAMQLLNHLLEKLEVRLKIRELFEYDSIRAQAALLNNRSRSRYTPIDPVPQAQDHPASVGQRRIWIVSQSAEASRAYHLAGALVLSGDLDPAYFEKAVLQLAIRHEILRTVFMLNENGELRQVVVPADAFSPEVECNEGSIDTGQLEEFLSASAQRGFDLARGPLFRVGLIRYGTTGYLLYYSLHHIICDGWSMEILSKELLENYAAYARREEVRPVSLRIQYKDYAAWQLGSLNGGQLKEDKNYWTGQFGSEIPVLHLPADRPRPARRTYAGSVVSRDIDPLLMQRLNTICQASGCTVFMGMFSVVNLLMHVLTGQNDMVIGCPAAGRDLPELEEQIGFYVNTLAIRTIFTGGDNFNNLLGKVKRLILGAYEHQAYPFDQLISDLKIQWDTSRSPLFDIMVVLQENWGSRGAVTGSDAAPEVIRRLRTDSGSSKFDLVFDLRLDEEGGSCVRIEYNSDLFLAGSIGRWADLLIRLLRAAVDDPSVPMDELDYLDAAEKHRLLHGYNGAEDPFPAGKSVITLFEEQADEHPMLTALVCDDRRLTYRELNEKANQFCRYLQLSWGIRENDLIGIKAEKKEWLIVAILGIQKAGCAYLPFDPAYPASRISYMMADAGCKMVVDALIMEGFAGQAHQFEKGNPGIPIGPDDPAYIIYTSGSTGNPKGVVIGHRSLSNLCFWHVGCFSVTPQDRGTLYAGVAFDASVWELFPYLISGASLYIIPEQVRLDVEQLSAFYEHNGITVAFLPTPIGEQLLETGNSSLRCLLLGGDKLMRVKERPYRIVNNYGPTENTVVTTSGTVTADSHPIPIGRPISNVRVYILNERRSLVPTGVIGEIYIGGAGLAKCYVNNTAMTEESFIPDPYRAGERLYRSGDLGRWLPDGNIEFAGRRDQQIKIRGHRVELGEIEHALLAHPSVSAAVVMTCKGPGDTIELKACIVAEDLLTLTGIRSYLSDRIPYFMIPRYIIQLPAFPLTPNGKIDRNILSVTEATDLLLEKEYAPPTGPVQEKLVGIWQEVMELPRIGIRDNFFEIGGNSLLAARIAEKIRAYFSVQLSIGSIFAEPTIEKVGEAIEFLLAQRQLAAGKSLYHRVEI